MIAILICCACCVLSCICISPFLPVILPILGLGAIIGQRESFNSNHIVYYNQDQSKKYNYSRQEHNNKKI